MKLTIARSALLKLVASCQGVAAKKPVMPALSHVLLTAEGDTLRASATDNFISATGSTTADIQKPGAVALMARDLLERVKAMPDGDVQLSVNDKGEATIKANGTTRKFTMRGFPASDFPPLPQPDDAGPSLTVPAALLSELIEKTHYAICEDLDRPHVNCAQLSTDGRTVRMVATDGHRLSKAEIETSADVDALTVLIPLPAVRELRKLVDDANGDTVTVRHCGSRAFFDMGGMRFGCMLVDGSFVPYQQVIPKDKGDAIEVDRKALTEALSAVRVAADPMLGGVTLTVTTGKLVVSAESETGGNSSEELPIDYEGGKVKVSFVAKYAADTLGSLDCKDVRIAIGGEFEPVMFRPVYLDGGSGFDGLVMPVKLG